jgi:hypothetical protein
MTVGTAIFLSAVILGAVALYGLTMDRWNWKHGLERFGRLLVNVLVVLGLLILLIYAVSGP